MKIINGFVRIYPNEVKKFHICGKTWDGDIENIVTKLRKNVERFETVPHFNERSTEKKILKTPQEVFKKGKIFEYKMYKEYLFRIAIRLHEDGERQDTIMVFQPEIKNDAVVIRCITAYKNAATDNHCTLRKEEYN